MTEGSPDVSAPTAETMAFVQPGDVATVRAFVRSAALRRGLPAARVELLVLAVSELTTNAIQHSGGGGHVRVWRDGRQIACEVVDAGTRKRFGEMPDAGSLRGRGLAIVQRVVDEVSTFAVATGSVVQIRMNS